MMNKKRCGRVLSKQQSCWAFLIFFSSAVCASVPDDNTYKVIRRSYAAEPVPQRFTISGHDQAFLVKPGISSYTQLNPLNPKAIYTIPPYPYVEFLPKLGKWMVVRSINSQPTYLLPENSVSLPKETTALVPAHWISLTNTRGQYIIEPINYVFIVYAKDK